MLVHAGACFGRWLRRTSALRDYPCRHAEEREQGAGSLIDATAWQACRALQLSAPHPLL